MPLISIEVIIIWFFWVMPSYVERLIGEIPTGQRGELFATYSGIAVLVEKLQNNIEKLTEDSEIFVRFPNTSRPDYKKVYSMMARVLWGRMMPGKIKISLSPASLETETE